MSRKIGTAKQIERMKAIRDRLERIEAERNQQQAEERAAKRMPAVRRALLMQKIGGPVRLDGINDEDEDHEN